MSVLLLRAGALGDILLLRRAIAALRAASHEPWLVAPEAGRVLLGPGGSEVKDLVTWDSADAAGLRAGTLANDSPLAHRLAATNAAIVFSRSAEMAEAVRQRVRRVLVRDPSPAHGHASLWLAEPTRELGGEPAALPPDLVATTAETDAAAPWLDRLPKGFLAVHPGSGSPAKNWPPSRLGHARHDRDPSIAEPALERSEGLPRDDSGSLDLTAPAKCRDIYSLHPVT